MPDDVLDATTAGSSPATSEAANADTSAGTQNTDQAGAAKLTPFHQHPDWQRMVRERNDARSETQRLGQTLQQLQQRLATFERQQTQGGALTPEEQRKYHEAGDALWQIVKAHPELKWLAELKDLYPALSQAAQVVPQLGQAHATGLVNSGRQQIAALAKESGLPATPEALDHIEEMVAGVLRRMEHGEARFKAGDPAVVGEAFQQVTAFLGPLRQQAAATLTTTKAKTSALPKVGASGLPGGTPPPKLEPGKERQFTTSLHQRALAELQERLTG